MLLAKKNFTIKSISCALHILPTEVRAQMKKDEQRNTEHLNDFLGDIQGGVILCNYNPETMAAETVYANRGWTDITGYTIKQLNSEKGGNPQALIYAEDKEAMDEKYMNQLRQGSAYELLYRIVHRSGKVRWVIDKGVTTILSNGKLENKSIVTDVTEIKKREERMALLAQTDQLTGLNNKATFTLLVQKALDRRKKNCCALLMLDIDSFKSINDNSGHAFGDRVLEAVAEQMKAFFRSGDVLGRVGGDEFMVLMTDVADEEAVEKKAKALCAAIHNIKIPQVPHKPITVSVGVTIFLGDKTFETIFAQADTALYKAKGQGKNQYSVWH